MPHWMLGNGLFFSPHYKEAVKFIMKIALNQKDIKEIKEGIIKNSERFNKKKDKKNEFFLPNLSKKNLKEIGIKIIKQDEKLLKELSKYYCFLKERTIYLPYGK